MKKRIFALLLSVLLLANATACNHAPEKDVESTFENTNTTESTVDETKTEAASQNANTESETWYSMACDGVYHNSNVKYTVNKNGDICFYIEDWNKECLVTSLSEDETEAFLGPAKAIVLNNDYAFLFLKRFDISTSKIIVLRFEKNGQC